MRTDPAGRPQKAFVVRLARMRWEDGDLPLPTDTPEAMAIDQADEIPGMRQEAK